MTDAASGLERFHELTEPMLGDPAVSRSTMMGLPCVRVDGAFFASCDRATGSLVAKLPKDVVEQMISTGAGEPFAPAGRQFKEWVAVPFVLAGSWPSVLAKAMDFAHSSA